MDKQILNFTVNEQILVCENPIKISTNKVNYIQAHFDLGTNWSGYDSIRAIWFNDFQTISTVLDSLGNCVVPFEVMKRKGNVKVNLVGSISEDDVLTDRLTSYPVVAVIVDCTAQITGANTSPITPSEYEQFVAAVHEDAERAEAGATNAETSAQNAHASEQNASQSAQSAHDDKVAIEEAIAEVIQQIEDFEQVQVVVNTLPPTSPATSDFTDGVLTLGIPQGVKGDTGNGIQSIRKTGTSGLVDTYTITFTDGQTTTFTVTNGAKGDTGNGISSIAKTSTVGLVDTYTITYTNGNTSTFTVTNGEKGDKGDQGEVSLSELEDATIVQTLSDSTPYNYRRTNNGNGAGRREHDEIVGASVGWNQLIPIPTAQTKTMNGVTFTNNGDGTITVNGTASDTAYYDVYQVPYATMPIPIGHKVLMKGCPSGGSSTTYYFGDVNGHGLSPVDGGDGSIAPNSSANSWYLRIYVRAGVTVNNLVFKPNLTDLTLFNSQIADYVYSLEQSTAGSGVTWLKTHFPKLFDNGYQPFDSGSIKSVSGLTAHEMVGKNLFEYTDYAIASNTAYHVSVGTTLGVGGTKATVSGTNPLSITNTQNWRGALFFSKPLIANTEYCISYRITAPTKANIKRTYYLVDENNVVLQELDYSSSVAQDADYVYAKTFTPTESGLRICFAVESSTQQTITLYDLCVNISDTSINGQYFPYEKHTYPLDSSVELRGKYYLDSNNQLRASGDIYKSGGEVERNFVEVLLNSVAGKSENESGYFWYSTNGEIGAPAIENVNEGLTAERLVVDRNLNNASDEGGITFFANNIIRWKEKGTMTLAEYRAYLQDNPITLVYKRKTPTTEQATPYTNPQWCDANGTEEYVGSELPVGHSTDYPMTLIDTADGLSNGTYEPRITIANGKKTVTWVSV